MIKEPSTLWVKVLKSKYNCRDEIIPTISQCQSQSNLWRGMVSIQLKVENNLIWRVNNSRSVNVWKDCYVPRVGPLIQHVSRPLTDEETNLKVSGCVNEATGWDWEIFTNLLPQEIYTL